MNDRLAWVIYSLSIAPYLESCHVVVIPLCSVFPSKSGR